MANTIETKNPIAEGESTETKAEKEFKKTIGEMIDEKNIILEKKRTKWLKQIELKEKMESWQKNPISSNTEEANKRRLEYAKLQKAIQEVDPDGDDSDNVIDITWDKIGVSDDSRTNKQAGLTGIEESTMRNLAQDDIENIIMDGRKSGSLFNQLKNCLITIANGERFILTGEIKLNKDSLGDSELKTKEGKRILLKEIVGQNLENAEKEPAIISRDEVRKKIMETLQKASEKNFAMAGDKYLCSEIAGRKINALVGKTEDGERKYETYFLTGFFSALNEDLMKKIKSGKASDKEIKEEEEKNLDEKLKLEVAEKSGGQEVFMKSIKVISNNISN